MIYEVACDFDIGAWRGHVISAKTQKFNVDMLRKLELDGQLPPKQLNELICNKIGCAKSRAYQLMHEGVKAKIFRYDEHLQSYAKISATSAHPYSICPPGRKAHRVSSIRPLIGGRGRWTNAPLNGGTLA